MSDQLPIPDYDHLPLGSLTHRIRSLDVGQIVTLLDHERAHADRLPVVQVLEQRLAALRFGDAEPSGGDRAAAQPEHAPPPSGWRELADRDRFVLALPEQKIVNNLNRCFNWFEESDVRAAAARRSRSYR